METWLVRVAEAALLLFIPGALTLAAALKRKKLVCVEGRSEFVFLSFFLSFLLTTLAGLLLAYLGGFSVLLLAGLLLAYSLLIVVFTPAPWRTRLVLATRRRSAAVILLLIVLLASLLFFRPVEYLFGGWDPGVYANTAVLLARSGSLTARDPVLLSLSLEEMETIANLHKAGYLEKYPGFRFGGAEGGALIPQFYFPFPVWLAIAYAWTGLRGMFYLTPFLGLFSLLAVYLAARELWDRRVAMIGTFLLTINIVEIWQARFPTSEMFAQFCFFSGVFGLVRYLKREEVFFARLAGGAFGLFLLTQISAALILMPLVVFFYARWFPRFRKADLAFWRPLLILGLGSLLPHVIFGATYARSVLPSWWGEGTPWGWLAFLALPAAVGLRCAPQRFRERLVARLARREWRLGLVTLLICLVWFGYFLRPYTSVNDPDKTNLIEFGWLLTPLGLLLGCLGLFLEVMENRKAGVWFFLLAVLAFGGFFIWRQLVHQHYLWAARRFAVVAVPGLILFAAAFLVRLFDRRTGRLVAAALFVLLAGYTAFGSRVIWRHDEYRGAVGFCEKLARRLQGAGLVGVEGENFADKIPPVLDLVYGYRVLPIYRDGPESASVFRKLVETGGWSGGPAYLLSDRPPPPFYGLEFAPAGEMSYHSPLLERRADRLPRQIDEAARDGNFVIRIYRVLPQGG